MKVSKFLLLVFVVTSSAIVYVWQNIHQIELSYQILEREKVINNLIDQNCILKYNVTQLKSPLYLENKLMANKMDLRYSKPKVLVAQLEKEGYSLNLVKNISFISKINKFVSRLFAVKREAEAKP